MLLSIDPNTRGSATDPWVQLTFTNSDGSISHLWLPGSAWSSTLIRGAATTDLIGSLNLGTTGSPSLGAHSANLGPTAFYTNPATVADLASGGKGGTALNKAIGRLDYGTSPTQIANNDTLTIKPNADAAAVTIAFKSSGAAGPQQVNIGASGTVTFTAVAALINANTDLYGCTAYVIGTNHTGSICFFSNALGVAGNAVTLAHSLSCTTHTLSGATLTGGDTPGLTLIAVAKTGGKFLGVGTWDSGDQSHISLGFWGQGVGNLTEGVTAYHYNTTSARFNAKLAAEAGVEGTKYVVGMNSSMQGYVWGARRHDALSSSQITFNSTGTPGALPTASGPLRLGAANGTNGAAQYTGTGDLAMALVVNRFITPMEFDGLYAQLKTNCLAKVGISI